MIRRASIPLVSIFLSIIVLAPTVRAAVPPPADLAAYVARALKTFDVPGAAVAIVKDRTVVLAQGYGVRTLGRNDAVDSHTLFGIASNTKLFTATALALLVEEGKIRWEAPVATYLPWFALSDPYVTRELTVRDLLVHRSGLGLGAGDLLWWPASTYNRREIASRLRYLPLATSFRGAYAYDNVLYLVAGEVIEAASGQSWEDFVSRRILDKVGMRGSNVRHSAAASGGNVATPHAPVDGTVRPIKPFDSDNTNPAGGINTSADDIAKWLLVQLSRGTLADGTTLFSDASARELTTLVTPMPIGEPPAELAPLKANVRGYALGLEVRDYRGLKLLTHTGGLPGYVSRVAMIPDLGVGVAVLTNQESTAAHDAIAFRVLDHYLGVAGFDWVDAYARVEARRASAARPTPVPQTPGGGVAPPLPLARYAGTFRDAWYGDVTIAQEGNRLAIRFSHTPALAGELDWRTHDTFVARWSDRELRADAYVTYAFGPDGSIDQVRMQAVSPDTDFSFDFQDLLLKPIALDKRH